VEWHFKDSKMMPGRRPRVVWNWIDASRGSSSRLRGIRPDLAISAMQRRKRVDVDLAVAPLSIAWRLR